MKSYDTLVKHASKIEAKLDYVFQDKKLLALAFVHRSYINEHKEISQHNERLEFLGDSILNLLMADYLYSHLPHTPEGELSYLRSRLVEANACMAFVQKLELENELLLGKGERMNDGRGRESILSDLFEAIIGAIYLDGGLQAARAFLFSKFSEEINMILKMPLKDFKTVLQDYCQKKYQKPPTYKVLQEKGPDHHKVFLVSVEMAGHELGRGQGNSKKAAQQAAAEDALLKINNSQFDESKS